MLATGGGSVNMSAFRYRVAVETEFPAQKLENMDKELTGHTDNPCCM